MATAETNDIDTLFTLPLGEFTSGRNALAARLKKAGQTEEANRVKAFAKPTVSAWAANQLYWNHRDAFERLIAAGQRFRQAQAMQFAGKTADIRGPLDERRAAIAELSNLAAGLLQEAGHNPSPDVLRRVATTLEAISAYTSFPDDSHPGRLSADLDPPGFDALSAFQTIAPAKPSSPSRQAKPESVTISQKEVQTRVALAKLSLQHAERALNDARIRAKSADVTLKKADADSKAAEMQKREAEERLEAAKARYEQATFHSRRIAAEREEALRAVADAERAVELASEELQALLKRVSAD